MASGGAKAGEREATAAGVGLDAAPRVVLPKCEALTRLMVPCRNGVFTRDAHGHGLCRVHAREFGVR